MNMTKLKENALHFMEKFKDSKATLLGAAQAYYYLLSIIPLFVVCFAIIPYLNINPEDTVQFLHDVMPSEMASVFEDNILSFVETPRGGLLTVGIIGVLWSASGAMTTLMESVNQAYDVEETRSFIKARLIAIGLTLGMIFTLIFAMLIPIFGSEVLGFVENYFGFDSVFASIFESLRWVIGFVLLTVFLMILLRFAPNIHVPFKTVFPGALVTSVLWIITSFGFSFYVSNFGNYSAVYGSLGGIIILMIWFYLTGIILIVGAITNVLFQEKKHIDPEATDKQDRYSS